MVNHKLLAILFCGFSTLALAGNAVAKQYRVTITNLTPGQSFTPQLVLTHGRSLSLFELGQPASDELALLAEAGDTGPMTGAVQKKAHEVTTIGALLGPGETAEVMIDGPRKGGYLSMAAMMVPTNDNFIALNGVRLPRFGMLTYLVPAYDAGSEYNDQSCQNVPGPRCGGTGASPEPSDGDEGFVHIGNGFHELGEIDSNGFEVLGPMLYDWRNPVAKVVVKRIH